MIILNYTLFAILIALQILDIILTKTLLESGNGKESNPIMRKLMTLFGLMPALVVSKLGAMIIVSYCIIYLASIIVSICCLITFNIFYLWIVNNNYKIYKKCKE